MDIDVMVMTVLLDLVWVAKHALLRIKEPFSITVQVVMLVIDWLETLVTHTYALYIHLASIAEHALYNRSKLKTECVQAVTMDFTKKKMFVKGGNVKQQIVVLHVNRVWYKTKELIISNVLGATVGIIWKIKSAKDTHV